jgi:hypothetical protein
MRWVLALFVVALALPARADVPPPPSSPDAHCSLAEQCAHGVFCPYAWRPGKPPAAGAVPAGEACRTGALAKGLERRCRHGGNYAGQELFCPKGETGSWSPSAPPTAPPAPTASSSPAASGTPAPSATGDAPPKSSSRCSAAPLGTGSPLPLAVALVLLAARRARRRER